MTLYPGSLKSKKSGGGGLSLRWYFVLTGLLLTVWISPAAGQELEPRAYSNIPVGLNFVVTGYTYQAGGVAFDPTVPLDNAQMQVHGPFIAYARSIDVGGLMGKIDIAVPFAFLSGTAEVKQQPVSRYVAGFADSRIRFSVNFIGAPALPMSGFKNYKQNLIVGASLQIYLPFSQYDPERMVNIGTNRFTFKPEIGVSKKFGPLFIDMATGAAFFTVDHDFFGGKGLSLSPIGYVQAHVIYSFRIGIWLALDGTYYWGGRPTVDGVEGNALQKNTRLGLTFAVPLGIHNSLKLYMSTGVSTRTGSDFDAIGLAWQYRWSKDLKKKPVPAK